MSTTPSPHPNPTDLSSFSIDPNWVEVAVECIFGLCGWLIAYITYRKHHEIRQLFVDNGAWLTGRPVSRAASQQTLSSLDVGVDPEAPVEVDVDSSAASRDTGAGEPGTERGRAPLEAAPHCHGVQEPGEPTST